MYSFNHLTLILTALLASVALAAPLPAGGPRTPPPPLARSRSPARTPPPAKGKGPASPAPAASASGVQTIIVKGVSYPLGEQLGFGRVGKVYSVPGGKVAKQFKLTGSKALLFSVEGGNTAQVLGAQAVAAGESQINKTGDKFGWIITPRVSGQPFHKSAGLQALRAKGKMAECQKWIKEKVQPEFVRKLIALERSSKLVHLDPHLGNVFWDSKAQQITGFIDFDEMDVVDGTFYNAKVKELGKKVPFNLDALARYFADMYYGPELCDPNTSLSDSSVASSRSSSTSSKWSS